MLCIVALRCTVCYCYECLLHILFPRGFRRRTCCCQRCVNKILGYKTPGREREVSLKTVCMVQGLVSSSRHFDLVNTDLLVLGLKSSRKMILSLCWFHRIVVLLRTIGLENGPLGGLSAPQNRHLSLQGSPIC